MSTQPTSASLRHEGVTVTLDPRTDCLVARKAVPPGSHQRLQREVAVLRHLDGLAVCAPNDAREDGSGGQVDLVYVGPRTLAGLEGLQPSELLSALAGIARTLQAAHERGVSHGRLTGDHVLLDDDGRPVLAGWSAAGLREDAQANIEQLDDRPDSSPDPAENEGPSLRWNPGSGHKDASAPAYDPAADIAALGELAARSAQANRLLSGRARTQLAAVAAAARHPDSSVRPPLTELVRVLELAGGTPDGRVEPIRRRHRPGRAPRAMRVAHGPIGRLSLAAVGAAAAAALTVIVLYQLASGGSAGPVAPSRSATLDSTTAVDAVDVPDRAVGPGRGSQPVSASTDIPTDRSGTNLSTASPALAEPTVTTRPNRSGAKTGVSSTIDRRPSTATPIGCPTDADRIAGEGVSTHCATTVAIDGEQIRVGTTRYALGAPGDQVGLSDPACSGLLTPVLWERSSGRVYLFDRWATATATVSGRLAGVVPGSTGLLDPLDEGCGPVRVAMTDGTVTELNDLAGG